jgi:hypothetical protein
MRTQSTCIAVMAAVVLILSGCTGGDEGDGGGGVKPPSGGWPKPENGQITAKMCGLLTPEDYEQFHHQQLLDLSPDAGDKLATNGVSCTAPPADILSVVVQPTAEAAKIWYQGTLTGRKAEVIDDKRETVLVENLVTGVDESWLDYWVDSGSTSKYKDYQLQLRRGALVIQLVLSGVTAEEKDPNGTLVALADRVLQRVGDLGRTGTGTTPKAHLEVKGTGRVESIQYTVPDVGSTKLENVKLPWSIDVPIADHGQQNRTLTIFGHTAAFPPIRMSCGILVDTKILSRSEGVGVTSCTGTLPAP